VTQSVPASRQVVNADGVGPAAVEAEQDRGVRADHLPQLGQDCGQGGGRSGGFARAEDDGPAAMTGLSSSDHPVVVLSGANVPAAPRLHPDR